MTPTTRRLSLLSFAAFAAACAKHSGDVGGLTLGSPPRFETRVEIDTGTGAHADYHLADLNGDTRLDMAVISLTGEFRVLLGNGASFVTGQEQQLGGVPIWITGGDLDGDGDRDLVVVRTAANSTDVWLNDGTGTFTAGASLPVGADALAVVVEDANGDGDLDVLVSRPVSPEIVTYLGDGLGGFTSGSSYALPGGGSAYNLQVGDVTRDAISDLIVADPVTSRVLVYAGQGGGTDFGTQPYDLRISGGPRAVSIGDLSGDGLVDLAVSAFESTRFVVVTAIDTSAPFGQGGGTSFTSFDVEVEAPPSLSTIGDVTGDGLPDLVGCLGGHATVVVAPQVPGGGLGELLHLDATGLPLRPFVGDFDRNGKNDLFALSGLGDRLNLWLAKNDGALLGARNHRTGLPGSAWVATGDFDGDGQAEVATASLFSSRVAFLGRTASGRLVPEFELDLGAPVFQLHATDLDRDGRVDLIAPIAGGIRLVRNASSNGTYVLQPQPGLVGQGDGPFGVTTGDLDRDGDLDLAFCDFLGGTVQVVPGTPTPFVFQPGATINVGGGPLDVAAADFTGDGRLDLVVSRANLSDLLVLRNDGGIGFSQFLAVPVGAAPNYLLTSDFNRDGRADLVVSNGQASQITVLFGGPNGFTGQTYAAGNTPTALLVADLTGDALPDILVNSLSSGDFRVLVGNGRGSFPDLVRFPGTLGAADAALQDLDGDGRADLVIGSLVSNRVSVVRNVRE